MTCAPPCASSSAACKPGRTTADHRDFRVHPRVLVIRRSATRFRRDAQARRLCGYTARPRATTTRASWSCSTSPPASASRSAARTASQSCSSDGYAFWCRTCMPVARRRDAGAHVGRAVHIHQAVGTLARQAQQAARPVIFEAAREDAAARAIERGRYGIAGARFDGLAVKLKVNFSVLSPRFLLRKERFQNFVGRRISHRLQPLPAARAVKPPLLLHAGLIGLGVGVLQPFLGGRIGRGRVFTSPPKRNS